jgi:hypothetical protein
MAETAILASAIPATLHFDIALSTPTALHEYLLRPLLVMRLHSTPHSTAGSSFLSSLRHFHSLFHASTVNNTFIPLVWANASFLHACVRCGNRKLKRLFCCKLLYFHHGNSQK